MKQIIINYKSTKQLPDVNIPQYMTNKDGDIVYWAGRGRWGRVVFAVVFVLPCKNHPNGKIMYEDFSDLTYFEGTATLEITNEK